MSKEPSRREFEQGPPVPRVSRDYVTADGWTVRLVSDERTAPHRMHPAAGDAPITGIIAGVAVRPPLWWCCGIFGGTRIGALPGYMPPYTKGANFSYTLYVSNYADWLAAFEKRHKGKRRPFIPLPASAPMLLGS